MGGFRAKYSIVKTKYLWKCLKVAWILPQRSTPGSERAGHGRGNRHLCALLTGYRGLWWSKLLTCVSACKHISSSGEPDRRWETRPPQGRPWQDGWIGNRAGVSCASACFGVLLRWLCWEVGDVMWVWGPSRSQVRCSRATAVASLQPLCCFGGAREWLRPMAWKAEDGTWNGVNNSRNCLSLARTWGSVAETGLLASLVQSWCASMRHPGLEFWSETSCSQTGFEKHFIFKLKAELKSTQPLFLREGGSPWMGGCMEYWRVGLLEVPQDHLRLDTEIKECSCSWCWDVFGNTPVHRVRL